MKIRILSPSDTERKNKHWWGDYWVQRDLNNEFRDRGYEIVRDNADLDIFLHGVRNWGFQPSAPRKFCWLYSHPDDVTKPTWKIWAKQFEHIFVLSHEFLPNVQTMFKNSSILLGGSSKKFSPRKEEAKYDVVFVGNIGKPARVQAIKHLVSTGRFKIGLVGARWEQQTGINRANADIIDPYVDNEKLGDLFNKAKLTFYIGHDDMRRKGFVAVRILDAFCSSECLCLSESNPGLRHIFRTIPVFENKEDLEQKTNWYLEQENDRQLVAQACREDAQKFTFVRVVDEIEKFI